MPYQVALTGFYRRPALLDRAILYVIIYSYDKGIMRQIISAKKNLSQIWLCGARYFLSINPDIRACDIHLESKNLVNCQHDNDLVGGVTATASKSLTVPPSSPTPAGGAEYASSVSQHHFRDKRLGESMTVTDHLSFTATCMPFVSLSLSRCFFSPVLFYSVVFSLPSINPNWWNQSTYNWSLPFSAKKASLFYNSHLLCLCTLATCWEAGLIRSGMRGSCLVQFP